MAILGPWASDPEILYGRDHGFRSWGLPEGLNQGLGEVYLARSRATRKPAAAVVPAFGAEYLASYAHMTPL